MKTYGSVTTVIRQGLIPKSDDLYSERPGPGQSIESDEIQDDKETVQAVTNDESDSIDS